MPASETTPADAEAVTALEQVERELRAVRRRRRQLDSVEGELWARRNRLERLLISEHGRAWWRARQAAGAPRFSDEVAVAPAA